MWILQPDNIVEHFENKNGLISSWKRKIFTDNLVKNHRN